MTGARHVLPPWIAATSRAECSARGTTITATDQPYKYCFCAFIGGCYCGVNGFKENIRSTILGTFDVTCGVLWKKIWLMEFGISTPIALVLMKTHM
ncbi:hypothetical protein NDU88_008470 [Pleurodeles waltl]|uniref:Uncharacterized protein n=1 Tax=Pleurodeles waltl TaxID=8319 RepID=A0AAV7RVU8_PLEWA|nr:hypothetical protein NDU88_008470 [Pleurodeles waltl]